MPRPKTDLVISQHFYSESKYYAREKLRWAIRFAQQNLKELKPGALADVHDECEQFLEKWDPPRPWGKQFAVRIGSRPVLSDKEVLDCQAFLKELLLKLATDIEVKGVDIHGPARRDMGGINLPVQITNIQREFHKRYAVSGQISADLEDRVYRFDLGTLGDLRDQIFVKLGNFLEDGKIELGQIRLCPECQNIFLLEARPRKDTMYHCSPRHARLAATRKFRSKQREKEKQRSKKRYETATRSKPHLRNAKIIHREKRSHP